MGKITYDQGIYLLEIQLKKNSEITVGKLGKFSFPVGYYYYIGSAQRRLKSRVERHLRQEKKIRWHIDYLIDKNPVLDYLTWPAGKEGECSLAHLFSNELQGQIIAAGFGSSDCKCKTHLFYFQDRLKRNLLPDKIETGSDDNGRR